MRAWVAVGALTLAGLLLVPGATAHLGAVEVQAEDSGAEDKQFEEIACIPACEVQASELGNYPPATVVTNNTTVTWTVSTVSLSPPHTATSDAAIEDKAGMVVFAEEPARDPCLNVSFGYDGKARFAIREGQLAVLSEDQFGEDPADQTWDPCEEAEALPGGAFALSYHCIFHKRQQHGLLVVLPEG